MAKHVCPWWIGYLLASPIRRWLQDPDKILAPYVREGMTVLDVGPGMGFFTLPAARMTGESGTVIAVDVQERMLASLAKRAEKAGLASRIATRLCGPDSIGISDPIDLCLAINVAHEVPDPGRLFADVAAILKPDGKLLLVEPKGHVSEAEFQDTLAMAQSVGLTIADRPEIRRSRSALLVR